VSGGRVSVVSTGTPNDKRAERRIECDALRVRVYGCSSLAKTRAGSSDVGVLAAKVAAGEDFQPCQARKFFFFR